MDVVTTFRNFGMGADDPVPQTDPKDTFNAAYGSAPLGSGMAFKIMSGARLSGTLHVYVVVFREARDLEATWSHMVANPMQGSFIATNKYRNANLIFIYFYGTSTPPDMNPYIAAFIGMR